MRCELNLRHTRRFALLVCGFVLAAVAARGEEPPPWSPVGPPAAAQGRTRIEGANGVRIDVTYDPAQGSPEAVLAALEEAARQIRERQAAVPAAPVPAVVQTAAQEEPKDKAEDAKVAAATEPPLPAEVVAAGPPCPAPCGPPWQTACPDGALALTGKSGDRWILMPYGLLFEPPLANPLQPRMYVKPTSLENDHTEQTLDTAIGAEIGLFRGEMAGPGEYAAFQLDFFAVVFSRWSGLDVQVADDYRFGFPLTFALGDWRAKIGYEHTSTHVGDELAEDTGRRNASHIRDEVVAGLAYIFWDEIRVYGIFGYALSIEAPFHERSDRYDFGVEWSGRQWTGWKGQPFAALDVEFRGDQNYQGNATCQAGWQWRNPGLIESLRLFGEYYYGKSPYGQFFAEREQWGGVGLALDF